MDLKHSFAPYWDCRILQFQYDALAGTLQFTLREPESNIDHPVVFEGVSFCFFLQNDENRFAENTFHELSSIAFQSDEIRTKGMKQKWLSHYNMDFNVVIEDICSTLILKATCVSLDSIPTQLETQDQNEGG
jgi:hypothetical protein